MPACVRPISAAVFPRLLRALRSVPCASSQDVLTRRRILASLARLLGSHAEAVLAVGLIGSKKMAACRAGSSGVEEPAAAANHAIPARLVVARIAHRQRLIVYPCKVVAPFHDVAVHVVQAQRVRLELTHRRREDVPVVPRLVRPNAV